MFRIIRFDLLLRYVVILSIIISVLAYFTLQRLFEPLSIFKLITISSISSLIIMFILLSPWFSRKVWACIRMFNKNLYPDLNGVWVGHVTTEEDAKFEVRALIRQSLLITEIDLHGESVKSVTLETTPTIEHNQKKLYYVYNSTPKNPAWGSYVGSTIFDVIEDKSALKLSGKYYTNRKSVGRIMLKRISTESVADISFY
ncbi:hypothetical protein [Psychrobium sp. 1_MG-2023]|uniref:Cap15 family cyclic dinucleotide receptor domain-containing protein n=1 Tax=Psychrobium sp. 1_MG-2023 TaxID=3062624 RepID=UPI00273490AE|nr:hypothetical protein [Psychrobium sp. 1_MG-2023]MDP2560762.1 hypothetical protein [Psychrobium sp. 1_MG-2023]